MGQARQRQEEIKRLKEQSTAPVSIDVLAYRHFDNNQQSEITYFSFEVNTCPKFPAITQNDLLHHICENAWGSPGPLGAISRYLLDSKSYQFILGTRGNQDLGVVINFHEKDPVKTESCSCRAVQGMSKKDLLAIAKLTVVDNVEDNQELVVNKMPVY